MVVFDARSSGLQCPQSYLFDAQENLRATLHTETSQSIPTEIAQQLRALNQRPRAWAAKGVAYLPSLPRCRLLVVGAGHIGQAVAQLAADLEFDVWVVDDRQEYVNAERFPRAEKLLVGSISELLPNLEITPSTYCLIVTRGHNHDEEALHATINSDARYIGLIGSRRKVKLIYEDLMELGISTERLDRVYAPIGLDINSKTVPEIAVSNASQLIQVRNNPKVGSRFDSSPSKMPTVKLD